MWIQNKARPLTLNTIQLKMMGYDESLSRERHEEFCLPSKNDQYPDVVYWHAYIRMLGKNKPHYIGFTYHKDNQESIAKDVNKLRHKYSTHLLGTMLGYLQPWNPREKTTHVLSWKVNGVVVFSEGLLDVAPQKLIEKDTKEEFLRCCLPSNYNLDGMLRKVQEKGTKRNCMRNTKNCKRMKYLDSEILIVGALIGECTLNLNCTTIICEYLDNK